MYIYQERIYIHIIACLYHVTTEHERGVASFHVGIHSAGKTGELDRATASDVSRRVC